MSFFDYIKEKWYMFVMIIVCIVFVFAIMLIDTSLLSGNLIYVFSGILLFLVFYIVVDFFITKSRIKKLSEYIKNGGTGNEEFSFPSDRIYSKDITQLANEFNRYRAQVVSSSADELDFITKWVHDVKVPISAMKLLLESDMENVKERLEMELSAIQQNTQKVLFHIKSRSFYDDYTISQVSTRSLINTSLKQFSTFFAYKKITLKLGDEDFTVLTDSKWSGYIISQLLSNAVKRTPPNGEITIKTTKDKDDVTISIKNTGQGIRNSDLQHIFNRGYTSNDNRSGLASTGYGLYLSKKLADKLGHCLTAASKYGEYAQFSLIFSNKKSM